MAEPTHLYWNVLERLTRLDEAEAKTFASLVEAAFEGTAAIEAAFDKIVDHKDGAAPERPTPVETWLTRIEVQGFRGVGPAAAMDLPPGPGLTVIKGRNGTGKSSFVDGLEVALTGRLKRLEARTSEWQGGWRNLHQGDKARVIATLSTRGAGTTRITRTWGPGVELAQGTLEVTRSGTATGLSEFGWDEALKTHWPILSYGELGSLLEKGPSHLFDALKGLLGLEELAEVQSRLSSLRKARERALESVRDGAKELEKELMALDDDRARTCRAALSGKTWRLDDIIDVALGVQVDERLTHLEALTHLEVPHPDRVEAVIARLLAAQEARAALAESDAGRHQATTELLERALRWHEHRVADTCPLCGVGALDDAWRDRTRAAIAAEQEANQGARATQLELNQAYAEAKRLCSTPPRVLAKLGELGLPGELADVWQRLATLPSDPRPLPLIEHLRLTSAALIEAHTALVAQVRGALNEVERKWAPLAVRLVAWHDKARDHEAMRLEVKRLKAAETWLKEVESELRDLRFAPISERAQTVWKELRQESSVSLESIKLTGNATRRKVELDVSVDGTDTTALAIMSQGELNALSLSLFIPRLSHDESPFRFVIIDDPVQAMDPFKVDGLAIVLRDLARTRQVIVLTHDTRLPDALSRMQVPATVYEVVRRAQSNLEVRLSRDPAGALIDNARALSHAEKDIGRTVTSEVVPALCRAAFEEALTAIIKRRILNRGEGHDVLRQRLGDARGTNRLAALALFDDAELGKDVMPKLGKRPGLVETYKAIREGSHEAWHGDTVELCRATETLIDYVRTVRP